MYDYYIANQNYNASYDGYFPGESPPTDEEFSNMLGTVRVVDEIEISENPSYFSSIDHSTSPYFPKVGNQVGPSCAAWAATYYQNGFYQAKDNNWTQALYGNPDQLMSPAWTYNKVLSGPLNYSSFDSNWNVINNIGCSKESFIPSDVPDYVNWGSENAWRCAPEFRCSNYYYWLDISDITNLKNAIIAGYVPYITVHADMYYLGLGQGDDTITSNELVYGSNHANTIVGFDDNKVADGEIGAFKIVNSWGETWGWSWGGCGYYWITYDAFIDLANAGHPGVKWFDDLVDYKPNLIGTW